MKREEVAKVLCKLKCGKVAEEDGIAVKFLKKWGDYWFISIFNTF